MKDIFPNAKDATINGVANSLNENMSDYGIDTYKKLGHFLAQVGAETGGLTKLTENLSYSFSNLCENYASNYSEVNNNTGAYANNAENWGNLRYGNRRDLGNTGISSGDGYRYRGRGLLHLTGRAGYTSFNKAYNKKYGSGPDFIVNPDFVANNLNYATISGLWFFNSRVMNRLDMNNASVTQVSLKVNGGYNGLKERKAFYNTAISKLR